MIRRLLPVVPLCLATVIGCSDESGSSTTDSGPATTSEDVSGAERTKVRIALNWYPEAEHGGFYCALINGYYEEAGLDVEIIPGGENAPVIPAVSLGRAEFGVTNADQILLGRAQGAEVVSLMAPIQQSPRCIVVHEKSEIESLDGLRDMTLAMNNSPFALYLKKKLPLENVKVVPYGSGLVAEFLLKDDFGMQGYVFSEPYVAESQGGDPKCLMVSDAGFNPYTSLLFTDANTIASESTVVAGVVDASIRGWVEYLKSPAETNRHIHELNPEMTLEILEYGVNAMKPLCVEEDRFDRVGQMTAERWRELADQLVEIEVIEAGAVQATEAYSLEFLPSSNTQTAD